MSAPPILSGHPVQWKYRLRPSLETDAPCSMNGEFTIGPRLTGADQSEKRGVPWPSSSAPLRVRVDIQISLPTLPARSEANTSVRPSSERLGCSSAAVVLSVAPRFWGVDQGSRTL